MAEQVKTALRILRRKQLEDRTGLSRSTIYARLNPKSTNYDPTFPKPIELGQGMKNPPVGWLESEVECWLSAQIQKSRGDSKMSPPCTQNFAVVELACRA